MKIGVNSLFLRPSQVGGAEFLLKGLLIGLSKIADVDLYIFINQEFVLWLQEINLDNSVNIVPIKILNNRFISEAFQLPLMARQYNLDGLINTNYFTPWKFLSKIPSTTIIHDLNYLHFPHLFSWYKKIWLKLAHKMTLSNADKTIAISDFVNQDIKKNYGFKHIPTVIHNPILWSRLQELSVPIVHEIFILSVANHYQHKNLATLVKAFAKMPNYLDKVKLILVGQLPDSLMGMRRDRCDDIRQLVKDLGLEDRVYITGYISDRELACYYHHAALFAFPSVFEGFGMPPVEAMGMGLPVLTTRCTAIPEVTMNMAEYVDNPMDISEWCDRLTEMLNNRDRYLPTESTIQKIRQAYEPVEIAKKYIDLFRILD
ncbi:glycosyltransferase family 4 protein [Pseudanabaena biceps]|nr:glycosyltransferase family 4 protein [Pseudanabaena biceps]